MSRGRGSRRNLSHVSPLQHRSWLIDGTTRALFPFGMSYQFLLLTYLKMLL
jgi:hypothetical protein